MKKLLIVVTIIFLFITKESNATTYGNEWIEYNLTYYKFKVGTDGVFRIPIATLTASGVPTTTLGSNFKLFRDGIEQPIFVSNENLTSTDYIEFIGKKPNGNLDKELYGAQPQANPRISLFTDTSSYYLTYDGLSNHLRYQNTPNTIPSSTPAPLNYCIENVGQDFKDNFENGKSYDRTTQFYSSQFDIGEGFVQALNDKFTTQTATVFAPNAVNISGVDAKVNSTILATFTDTTTYLKKYEFQFLFNNQLLTDTSSNEDALTLKFNYSVPSATVLANNEYKVSSVWGLNGYQKFGISFIELEYPRNFDVAGLNYFNFKLPASASNQYIEFTNWSNPTSKLYDITNNQWYVGDNTVAGKQRYFLNPSAIDHELVLLSDGISASNLSISKKVNFIDYSQFSNQGNYVIITHKNLMTSANGHNYIQDYKDYRSSATGGGYNVQIVDVNDLYDQFAYGIDLHPLSIRHFLNYAYDNWTATPPKHVCLIGRGILYNEYSSYKANPSLYNFSIVPTYGNPGSDLDFVNFGTDILKQKLSIGRISVWNSNEISTYLDKVKSFEAALLPAAYPNAQSELWKKLALQIGGGNTDLALQNHIIGTFNSAKLIIEGTFTGKKVDLLTSKSSGSPIEYDVNNGLSMINFYGHASPSTFEYGLKDLSFYNSKPKFPFFLALGCDVAQMFALQGDKTIAEKYILHPNAGSIVMVASDNAGFTDLLPTYMYNYYASIANKRYTNTMGEQFLLANDSFQNIFSQINNINSRAFTHCESFIYAGDPAIKLYAPLLPDYHVNNDGISSLPSNVTTALDSFKLKIVSYNLAQAKNDYVDVKIEHTNPAGITTIIKTYTIPQLNFSDTSYFWVKLDKLKDIGLNKYKVTIDYPNTYAETSEINNTGTLDLFISSDNLIPIYPYNFSIVHDQGVILKASTLNPFAKNGKYDFEIDTTELFNSPFKKSTVLSNMNGLLKWAPQITMIDSTVYYWRTASDSAIGGAKNWANSSFIYLANGSDGWNQSHYFQYTKDGYNLMDIDSTNREFKFTTRENYLKVRNKVAIDGGDAANGKIDYNFGYIQRIAQEYFQANLQIMVLDSNTSEPWKNSVGNTHGALNPGLNGGVFLREFAPMNNKAIRDSAIAFLNFIPDGNYIMIRNTIYNPLFSNTTFINDWLADTLINGSGKSLYHTIKNLGFDLIDSFTSERVFVFMRKKGSLNYPIYQKITNPNDFSDMIDANFTIIGTSARGYTTSVEVGPAQKWETLRWRMSTPDNYPTNDTSYVSVFGENNGVETYLFTTQNPDTSLALIDPIAYPKLKLQWLAQDTLTRTPHHLDYWRVLYKPIPEAALNTVAYFVFNDSLQSGQNTHFGAAVENLTPLPMDSMLINFKIISQDGVSHDLLSKKFKPLLGLDTLHADIDIDPMAYPGKNNLFIEVNPNNNQPEQYHPNNLGYLPFRVISDKINPLMDVTFDAVHILDKDYISSKPFIKILLKDENNYRKLDDTSLLRLYLQTPLASNPNVVGAKELIPIDGTICKFIPAQSGNNNQAYVEYRPVFSRNGTYNFFVNGKDKSGNESGNSQGNSLGKSDYQISFQIQNHSSISNVFNFPNPFSTSTSFVFTLTGSTLPSQFKIQIISVTGKVVREITKQEIGTLHIGRNITDYKWDGRDQNGQLLGNGVYLYRVVSTINNNDIDKLNDNNNISDKYFKDGYGKLYIMR